MANQAATPEEARHRLLNVPGCKWCEMWAKTKSREAHHELLFPPHLGGMYVSSALCSCGDFQWDAPTEVELFAAQQQVRRDWNKHAAQLQAGRKDTDD